MSDGTRTIDKDKLLFNRDEAAQLLSISVRSIDNLIKADRLKVVRVCGRILINKQSMIDLASGAQ